MFKLKKLKKGSMIRVKKVLGVGLILIALFFIFAGISAHVEHKVFGVTGIIDDGWGWIALIGTITVCILSAYFLLKSGSQR